MAIRHKEADEFYDTVIPQSLNADQANVMRQALAGMLWTQAVLSLRRRQVARRARLRSVQGES